MFSDISIESLIILIILCFLASFIDAIAGGGGLISLPAYISAGFPIHLVMGTHKFSATLSTLGSSVGFFKHGKLNFNILKYLVPFHLIGACLGVYILNKIDENFLEPIIIFLLILILIYTIVNKEIGLKNNFTKTTLKSTILGSMASFILGFYIGFFGPGGGSFLLFAFIKIYGMDFILSSGNAKILNLVSNLSSLIMFIYYGKVNYIYGFTVGFFMFLGGQLGTKFAIKKGSKLIKPFFIVVTTITLLKIIIEKFF